MTSPNPYFPRVGPDNRLYDKHLPQRLQSADLKETIEDSVGSMTVGVDPVKADYNDTLGQLAISFDQSKSTYGAQCRLYRNGTQNIAAGTITAIVLNTSFNNDNGTVFSTDLTTGRITALQSGSYLASWAVRFAAATNGERYSSIGVNGANNTRLEAGGTRADLHTVSGSGAIRLLANDYVNLAVYVSGAAVDIQGGNNFHTWLSLTRLGA